MNRSDRKRRTSWIDAVLTTLILALVIVGGVFILFPQKEETAPIPEPSKNTNTEPTRVDSTNSNYPGIKIITEVSNDAYTPFAIQYPQSLHSSFNQKISSYVQNKKQEYLASMEDSTENDAPLPGELNISFETFPHHSGTYSFILVTNRYSGGANGTMEIRSFHLNPDTGIVTTIQDVFEHDELRLEQLAHRVREKLTEDPTIAKAVSPVDLAIHTEPDWNNFKNFALTDEEIIFYFDEYAITDGSVGVPIVSIPLSDLEDFLAADYKLPIKGNHDQVNNEIPENDVTVPENTNETIGSENDSTDVGENETESKRVALTFDDGPDPTVTLQILKTLEKYNAKATFFMLGSRVEYYPEIAKSVGDADHELANHTWNHPDLTKLGAEKIRNEILNTTSIIESVTGKKVTGGFRPPYGAVNNLVRAQTELPVILWDVDTLDWKHRNAAQLLSNVKKQTKNGSIILMHDIHQSTADGLAAVLDYLQNEGYEFVKVSELNK